MYHHHTLNNHNMYGYIHDGYTILRRTCGYIRMVISSGYNKLKSVVIYHGYQYNGYATCGYLPQLPETWLYGMVTSNAYNRGYNAI